MARGDALGAVWGRRGIHSLGVFWREMPLQPKCSSCAPRVCLCLVPEQSPARAHLAVPGLEFLLERLLEQPGTT